MIETTNATTAGTHEFLGKLFPEASEHVVSARDWKFGILRRVFPYALLVFDALLIVGIFTAMMMLRHGDDFLVGMLSKKILAVLIACSVFGIYLIGGYSFRIQGNSARFVSEHVLVSMFTGGAAISIAYAFITYGTGVSAVRSAVMPTLIGFPICSIVYRYYLERAKMRRCQQKAICVLGATWETYELIKSIRESGHGVAVHVFDSAPKDRNKILAGAMRDLGARWEPLSKFDPLETMVAGKQVETVILGMPLEEMEERSVKELICSHTMRNQVVTLESYVLSAFKYVPTHLVSPSWAFGEGFRINSSLAYNRAKRLFDFMVALIGLVVVSPLMLATALAVRLTSPGPVFFRQERVGRHEAPFTLYKFRTMVEGAEKLGDYTAVGDTRLTRIGNFLRRSRLDEFPQLWNVLKGDMSIVGPRPEWSKLVENYEGQVKLYHYRHLVRPGITGWAQVCYPYGASVDDAVKKLRFDLYYVRYYSLVLDITIVIKTAYTMIFGRGR